MLVSSAQLIRKSKDTYGQTRGLSNLEEKHASELALIGLFLKGVKTSRVLTTQGSSYITKNKICLFVAYH